MSYNLVDPTTGDLTRVAGGIDTSIIPSNASASNKLVTTSNMAYLLKDKMSCYTWDTNKTLRAVFYEVTDRDIMPDVNDTVGKRVVARYGNVLINRITQLNGIKNFYWDDTLVLSCPFNDDITKLTDVLEIFVGTTSWQQLATMDKLGELPLYSGNLNDLHPNGFAKYRATYSDLTNAPTVSYTPQMCYIDVWGDTANIYQMIRIVGVTYNPIVDYSNTYIRSSHYTGSKYEWSAWGEIITSNNIGSQTVASANKIVPNYTSAPLATVTSNTIKYIKLADCVWSQTGTLQVHLAGDAFEDILVINFGGGNALHPMLCGHYSGNDTRVMSVIAQKGSAYNTSYSIYVKIEQITICTVKVALLKGDCTINITESTTAPTNISEWKVDYGLFGNITSPNLASLEERVTALESKL